MLVHQILKAKSDDGVVTLPEGTTVSEAVEVLSSRKIGAIVISNDGKTPTGIISERDIVRELGRQGAACLVETVGSVMTKNLISCARDDTADQVLAKMTEGRFRHMPVLDADVMIGLISIGVRIKRSFKGKRIARIPGRALYSS